MSGLPAGWRTALVTGASSGIGRSFAVALAKQGLSIVAVARRQDRLEELATELGAGKVEILVADLSNPDDLARVEARLADAARPIDVLVNGAGFGTTGKFVDSKVPVEQQEIDVNISALMRLSRAAVGGMVARRTGAIVNVSSIAGEQPMPYWTTYAATKAYVTSFSRGLSSELKGTGVRVLTVMPGWTRTEFHLTASDDLAHQLIPGPVWMAADTVVASAMRSLARGRTENIPGLRYRFVALATRLSPWPLTRIVLRLATRKVW